MIFKFQITPKELAFVLEYATTILKQGQDSLHMVAVNTCQMERIYRYHLADGISVVTFENHDITFDVKRTLKPTTTVIISFDAAGLDIAKTILEKLIDTGRKYVLQEVYDGFLVEKTNAKGDEITSKYMGRSLESVFIDESVKKSIVDNLTEFYSDNNTGFEYGLDRSLTYVLSGPQNSGRTSLVYALTTHFKKVLRVVDLATMDVDSISKCASFCNHEDILLIKNVDHALERHGKTDQENNKTRQAINHLLYGWEKSHFSVTFIITSHNSIDSFFMDSRLVQTVKFEKFGSVDQLAQMYDLFFPAKSEQRDEFIRIVQSRPVAICVMFLKKIMYENRNSQNFIADFQRVYSQNKKQPTTTSASYV